MLQQATERVGGVGSQQRAWYPSRWQASCQGESQRRDHYLAEETHADAAMVALRS